MLYGGFVVYDTDAKRMWAGVRTRGVYTEQTAYQMAYGSLLNSRAMVSIAVTGHAMPFFDDRDELGIVDIGVAVRTTPTITVETCRVEHCIGKDVNGICTAWKNLHSETGGKKTFPPFQITAMVADVIRLRTSAYAMRYATVVVERIIGSGAKFDNIAKKSWDAECKPSWIIETRLVDSHDVSKTEPKGNDAADIKETADIPYFM